MTKTDISLVAHQAINEISREYKKASSEIQPDLDYALSLLAEHGGSFSDAARELHRTRLSQTDAGVSEEDFTVVCASACGGIIRKLQVDGHIR